MYVNLIYKMLFLSLSLYIYTYIKFKYHPRNSESGVVNLVLVMAASSSVKLTLTGLKQRGDPMSLSSWTRTTNSEEMTQGFWFTMFCLATSHKNVLKICRGSFVLPRITNNFILKMLANLKQRTSIPK